MKFKPNYLSQFTIFMIMILYSLTPGLVLMILILDMNVVKNEIFKMIISFLLFPIIIFIIFSVINFLITLFVKPQLCLYKDEFIYKNKNYKYSDIIEWELDLGTFSRTQSNPLMLILYRTGKPGVVINNPSLCMIINMRKKFKNIKFRIEGWKISVFLIIFGLVIGTLMGIFGRS